MKAKTRWNAQSTTDTVAFSALISTGIFLAWLAAAAPIVAPGTVSGTAPAVTQAALQPADQANGPVIADVARRPARSHG